MLNPIEIETVLKHVQKFISADCRADDEIDEPSLSITFGSDGKEWGYQTGDNSYSGAAYHFAFWSVQTLTRDTDCKTLAEEIVSELEEMAGTN